MNVFQTAGLAWVCAARDARGPTRAFGCATYLTPLDCLGYDYNNHVAWMSPLAIKTLQPKQKSQLTGRVAIKTLLVVQDAWA